MFSSGCRGFERRREVRRVRGLRIKTRGERLRKAEREQVISGSEGGTGNVPRVYSNGGLNGSIWTGMLDEKQSLVRSVRSSNRMHPEVTQTRTEWVYLIIWLER